MKQVFRVDRGTLRKPERTPQGFLRADGIASRIGVFEYLNGDGSIRRELRLPEEVFAKMALDGFEGASLTDGHPPEPVTADNVKQYEVGTVTEPARRDGDHVLARIVVKNRKTISKLEAGDTGLSVGYAVDLDETPGVHPQYGRYDAIQRNLVINHLAVGVNPRAGNVARVRMDAAEQILDDAAAISASADQQIDRQRAASEGVITMADDKKTDKQRADELEATAATLRAEVTRLEGLIAQNATAAETAALTAEKQRADAADQKVRDLEAAFDNRVRGRVALLVEARTQLGATIRLDDMSDRQIQEAVIKRLDGTANVSGENDDQVRGRYKTLMALAVRNTECQARVAEIIGRTNEGARNDADQESFEEHEKNRWKKTLNKGRAAAQEGR